jgi:hypothetical protein
MNMEGARRGRKHPPFLHDDGIQKLARNVLMI